ncbi:MAG: hypothetical protein C5B59_19170 [Bacteroidetes bacterium]|nr:MAG: hypothetical protein C5B59_19170 [Bacteroidota bacterium]
MSVPKLEYSKKRWAHPFLWVSFLINGGFFFLVLFFTKPIYKSDDDVFLAYLLGGGFGKPPTALLHYNHGMHPLLGVMLKSLFTWMGSINWYTVFLYLCHFIACNIILLRFLKLIELKIALGLYTLLFIVFECRFLMQPTFTSAAILLGIGGLVLLLTSLQGLELKRSQMIIGFLVLILAALIRIHVLLPLVGISLPFIFFTWPFRAMGHCLIFLILSTGLIILLNLFHQSYYKSKIDGWDKDEKYRQAFFHYINHPHAVRDSSEFSSWSTESNLARNGLLIDPKFVTERKLYAISNQYGPRSLRALVDNKWLYLQNRIYFITLLVIALYIRFDRRQKVAFFTSTLLSIFGILYLSIYEKVPPYLFTALFFFLGILMILHSQPRKAPSKIKYVQTTCLLLMCIWGFIQLYKINSNNKKNNEYFRSAYKELDTHNKTLFLVTDDEFPLDNFYVWDTPGKYKIENLVYKENLLADDYVYILKRFQLQSLSQLPEKENVLLWGKRSPGLIEYYQKISGHGIIVSGPLKEFKHEVYSIRFADSAENSLQGHGMDRP